MKQSKEERLKAAREKYRAARDPAWKKYEVGKMNVCDGADKEFIAKFRKLPLVERLTFIECLLQTVVDAIHFERIQRTLEEK